MTCHSGGPLVKASEYAGHSSYPRCSSSVHLRKPDSFARTWAFLISAIVLYIPANVLPAMSTSFLFGCEKDTILSGVVYLFTSGSRTLAVVVFVASIVVPMLKIIALVFLVPSAQMRSTRHFAMQDTHLPALGPFRALIDARYPRHHYPGCPCTVQRASNHPGGACCRCVGLDRCVDHVGCYLNRLASDLRRFGEAPGAATDCGRTEGAFCIRKLTRQNTGG